MLNIIDEYFLELFQKISDKCQINFGKDCFWMARLFLFFRSILISIFIILGGSESKIVYCFCVFLVFDVVFHGRLINDVEKDYNIHKDSKESFVNGFVRKYNFLRKIHLIYLFPGFYFTTLSFAKKNFIPLWLLFSAIFCGGIIIYFLCCTPLPLCKSKAKEFLESFFLKPAVQKI